jgi:G:T-mismatch repair DNA endonuclease (very short patch repair protein)
MESHGSKLAGRYFRMNDPGRPLKFNIVLDSLTSRIILVHGVFNEQHVPTPTLNPRLLCIYM